MKTWLLELEAYSFFFYICTFILGRFHQHSGLRASRCVFNVLEQVLPWLRPECASQICKVVRCTKSRDLTAQLWRMCVSESEHLQEERVL
jgi:hypothetical protein